MYGLIRPLVLGLVFTLPAYALFRLTDYYFSFPLVMSSFGRKELFDGFLVQDVQFLLIFFLAGSCFFPRSQAQEDFRPGRAFLYGGLIAACASLLNSFTRLWLQFGPALFNSNSVPDQYIPLDTGHDMTEMIGPLLFVSLLELIPFLILGAFVGLVLQVLLQLPRSFMKMWDNL
ncbi:hypothetical protein O4H49_03230 [Kiloniella laminariae]|uniref:Uncharacterized protein n=1 Tax=Kiloniella laminariae TaxID=454162 RepID=A0ABT4LF91_9PROT|nr:hypothetical protein [Kiloniella laminariae]MCZ4279776.1 hypothetical protein [Kiloniella laminariae]